MLIAKAFLSKIFLVVFAFLIAKLQYRSSNFVMPVVYTYFQFFTYKFCNTKIAILAAYRVFYIYIFVFLITNIILL